MILVQGLGLRTRPRTGTALIYIFSRTGIRGLSQKARTTQHWYIPLPRQNLRKVRFDPGKIPSGKF